MAETTRFRCYGSSDKLLTERVCILLVDKNRFGSIPFDTSLLALGNPPGQKFTESHRE